MKLILAVLLMAFSSAHATTDLTGTYTGCGKFEATGNQQIYFHLVKVPNGFGPDDFQYSAGFILGLSKIGTFFPKVDIHEDQTKMLMHVEIQPRRDYGTIIKTIFIEILPDQTITGRYFSNAAIAGEPLSVGNWTAKKVERDQDIPVLKCN